MPDELHDNEIAARRELILSELGRANRAAIGIVIAVAFLAMAVLFAAHKAQGHAAEAVAARGEAQKELWRSQLAHARAARQSVAMGRRVEAWKAITNAAAFAGGLELRNEAIAALATPDIRQLPLSRPFEMFKQMVSFDATGDRYIEVADGVTLRRTSDNAELWKAPQEIATNWHDAVFTRAGRWVSVMTRDGGVAVFDTRNNARVRSFAPGEVWSFSFSHDDNWACISEPDGFARVFHLPDWQEQTRFPATEDDGLDLSDDGSRVALRSQTGSKIEILDWRSSKRIAAAQPVASFALAWRPDGEAIAVAGKDRRIRLFDARSGTELGVLTGHNSQPIQLLFAQGQPWLVSMGWDGTTRLWDTISGEEVVRVPHYGDAAFLNRHGQFGWRFQNNSMLELFQVESPNVVSFIPQNAQPAASRPIHGALSLDEKLIVTAAEDGLRIWSADDRKLIRFLPIPNPGEIGFARSGAIYFSGGGKFFRLEAVDGEPRSVEKISGDKFRLSSNGDVIASMTGQRLEVWRGAKFLRWEARQEGMESIALSPDGRLLATGTRNHIGLRVWDAETGKLKWTNDVRHGSAVAFSPDSRSLLTASTEAAELWDAANGTRIWRTARAPDVIMGARNAVSPDGRYAAIASSSTEAMLLDLATGTELATLRSPNPRYIAHLGFSGGGKYMAISYEDRSLQIWDLQRLQTELAAVGLGWQQKQTPGTNRKPTPGEPWLLAFAGVGAVVSALLGIAIFNRHRRLLRGYLELEAVAMERQKQLGAAEKELARGQKMTALGTLAAGVAHDFNNLLSVIRMANTGIARATRRAPEIAEDLQDIESAVVDGKRIVQSMLGYTRDGIGPVESFSVGELLEETLRLLNRPFLTGIHVHLDVDANLPKVSGYPGRLRQILLNLIVNASEAMNGPGDLWIEARRQSQLAGSLALRPSAAPEYLLISVRDNGPGIDPQTRARIFEPFFTTKTSGTPRGAGLGLALVYTMAEQDGLGLTCQSTPGQGATFTILFPLKAETGSGSPITTTCA